MSDETTGVVTDEELAAALDGTIEQAEPDAVEVQAETADEMPEQKEELVAEVVEGKIPETAKDAENAERSSLGRKVARQAREIEELKQLVLQQQTPKPKAEDHTEDDDEIILTRAELREFLAKESSRKEKDDSAARSRYVATLEGFAEENDPDTHELVISEVFSNHNKIHTGDPVTDAKINYRNAEREILRRELAAIKGKKEERVAPLKGGQPKVSLGVSGSSVNITHKKTTAKLSDLATQAAKEWNLSEEEIAEAIR